MRFALGPLAATFLLEVAFGDVVADAIAGNVIERIGLGDVFGAGADDGGDLDFQSSLIESRGFSTLSFGPLSEVLAFRKKIGSGGMGLPVSLAWST